jgi:hypothetical protein
VKVRAVDLIQWAPDCETSAVEDVGVDHGGLDVLMAEEVLHSPNVIAVFQEMGGEGMAEGMAADVFGEMGAVGGEVDGPLEGGAAGVVPAADPGPRVGRDFSGGEDELPDPLAGGVGVFPLEGFGEIDGAKAGGQILLVEGADVGDVTSERLDEGLGQDRDPVAPGFGIPD